MPHFKLLSKAIFLALFLAFGASVQAQEIEPNDPCNSAQVIAGQVSLPTTIAGSLDSTPDSIPAILDIDFFRFVAEPGQDIQIDLEGQSTNAGTLGDPLLGVFDSECIQLDLNDDGGSGVNSRLSFQVPDTGVFVVGATTYPDFGFVGGGIGTYLLTLSRFERIDSISGRIVNANGDPLSGIDFPFAYVQLFRCNDGQCFEFAEWLNAQSADDAGRFFFDHDYRGRSLAAGTYQLAVNAAGFEYFVGEPFEVLEGDARDLGDVALVAQRLIGTVSGRLVDAVDNTPLGGHGSTDGVVVLERCEEFFCYGLTGANTDEQGYFRIQGPAYGIAPGRFRLRAFATGYSEAVSAQFDLLEFEDLDVGDFPIEPLPIQFLGATGCEIPSGGGPCVYSAEIRYRGLGRYKGEAWGSVEVYGPPTYTVTRFQVGKGGTANPKPQKLNLKNREIQTLSFDLDVPGSVPDGTSVCGAVTIGRGATPQFDTQGTRVLFCAVKYSSGFRVLSDKEMRKQLRRIEKNRRVDTTPGTKH